MDQPDTERQLGPLVGALRKMREDAGLTQEDLAARLGFTGKSPHAHISRIERGLVGTTPEVIEAWIEACQHQVFLVNTREVGNGEGAVALLAALPAEDRELLLELAFVLPYVVRQASALREQLARDVDYWRERYGPAAE